MRTPEQMRETAFIVARQNRADGLDNERPMPAAAQLHFDVLDLLAALAEEKAQNAQERHSVKVLMGIELADKDVETRQALMWYKKALADVVAKDEEIDYLKAELTQSHLATEKLSRGLWKDC